jgi:hypothetical protein
MPSLNEYSCGHQWQEKVLEPLYVAVGAVGVDANVCYGWQQYRRDAAPQHLEMFRAPCPALFPHMTSSATTAQQNYMVSVVVSIVPRGYAHPVCCPCMLSPGTPALLRPWRSCLTASALRHP